MRAARTPTAAMDIQKTRALRPRANAAITAANTKPHATHAGGSETRNESQPGSPGKSVKAKSTLKMPVTTWAGHAAIAGEITATHTVGNAIPSSEIITGIASAFS